MQRGFSLVELAVTVGVIAALLLAAAAFALGSRPFAMDSAATEFESQLQAARALAATGDNGATIVVQPRFPTGRTTASGFKSIVYAGRPTGTGALSTGNVAPVSADADISEVTLGAPPFAIFISASGHVSMEGSYPSPAQFDSTALTPIAGEPPCPAAGNYTLAFTANGASRTLVLPCTITVSGTPVPFATNTPSPSPTPSPTPNSTPTPCVAGCGTPTPAPTPCAANCITPTPCAVNCTPQTPAPSPTPTPCAGTCGTTLLNTSSRWVMPVGGCNVRTGTCQVNRAVRTITLDVPLAPLSSPVHVSFSFTDNSTADSFFPMASSISDPGGNAVALRGTGFWQGDLSTGPAGTYRFVVEQGCQTNGNAVGTQNCSLTWTFVATQ